MKRPTVFDVANYFLSGVDYAAGGSMTHLKLQKLCYYAQAWHLVFEDKPLFDEHFEAWIHGPASPLLWGTYKEYSWNSIPPPDEFEENAFTGAQAEVLNAVWEAYGQFDGKYLEELTHQEDPWKEARKGLSPGDHCTNKISLDVMKAYYKGLQG